MRPARLVVAAAAVLVAVGLVIVSSFARDADPAPVAGELVWSDEFDGAAGQGPDPSRWKNDVGGTGWGNEELQYYTEGSANAALDGDGNLVIEARSDDAAGLECHYGTCSYSSARLQTSGRFGQMHGRVEARMKVPAGTGLWPAFWMLGDDIVVHPWPASGEIDIMEHVGHEPTRVKGSAHGPGYSGTQSYDFDLDLGRGRSLSDGFHTFAVDWTPERITWTVDDEPYGTLARQDLSADQQWVFDKPYFLLLNLAVGGVWPGPPDADTEFPARMVVDYVRVYDLAGVDPVRAAAPPQASPGQPAHLSGYARKCLDVEASRVEAGARVHLWDCLDVDSQRWTLADDATVRSGDLCLAALGERPGRGAAIALADCSGAASQRFTYDPDTDALVHAESGLCLDVVDWATRNGAPLQLWDCAGSTNQRWHHTA